MGLILGTNLKRKGTLKNLNTFFWVVKLALQGREVIIQNQSSVYLLEHCLCSHQKLVRVRNSNIFHYFKGKASIILSFCFLDLKIKSSHLILTAQWLLQTHIPILTGAFKAARNSFYIKCPQEVCFCFCFVYLSSWTVSVSKIGSLGFSFQKIDMVIMEKE